MSVSAKIDYACLAVLALAAEHEQGQPVPLRTLAKSQSIPSQFLSQILQQLRTAGLVQSSRGAAGGYQLTRSPEKISLLDVVSVFETKDKPNATETSSSPLCTALHHTWNQLADDRQASLAATSFADLLLRVGKGAEPMYYI